MNAMSMAQRSFRPDLPAEPTGLKDLDAAVAVYREQLEKSRLLTQEIAEAEANLRRADATDLKARAAAELAGKADPGPRETTRIKGEIERLADRRRVLMAAIEDAATQIALVVDEHRSAMLAATGKDLAAVRVRYLELIAELGECHERLGFLQSLRGWLGGFPPTRFVLRRGAVVGEASIEQVLEALRTYASVEAWGKGVRSTFPELVRVEGEGEAEA